MAAPFKSYDIRGTYPDEIDEEFAYKLGRAIVVHLEADKVAVGRDCRLSSPALTKSLIYGMTDQGADVIDLGMISTPMSYYASKDNHVVMVTASHNPAEYNGFKLTKKGVRKVGYETGYEDIEVLVRANRFPDAKRQGKVEPKDIIKGYCEKIREMTEDIEKLRVIFDVANGMGGIALPKLLEGYPIEYEIMYKEPDGHFPNHLGDPVKPENTAELQAKVLEGGYDIGIAYDTDCDRVIFIDEKGNRIKSDPILVLLAQERIKNGDCVVKTVSVSRIVDDKVREIGGRVWQSKVGHVHVPKVMEEHGCKLAGEISGHFYFKDFWNVDCGDAAVMAVLSLLSRSGKKMSELIEPLMKYARSEEINITVEDQDKSLENIEKGFPDAQITKLDGLSVDAGSLWFNIRKSNTEPLLRLNAEAANEEELEQGIKTVEKLAKHL